MWGRFYALQELKAETQTSCTQINKHRLNYAYLKRLTFWGVFLLCIFCLFKLCRINWRTWDFFKDLFDFKAKTRVTLQWQRIPHWGKGSLSSDPAISGFAGQSGDMLMGDRRKRDYRQRRSTTRERSQQQQWLSVTVTKMYQEMIQDVVGCCKMSTFFSFFFFLFYFIFYKEPHSALWQSRPTTFWGDKESLYLQSCGFTHKQGFYTCLPMKEPKTSNPIQMTCRLSLNWSHSPTFMPPL